MITCRQLAEALGNYVAGELSAEHRDGVDGHLGACPPCVALLESYRVTIRLGRRLPPLEMPAGLLARLESACQGDRS